MRFVTKIESGLFGLLAATLFVEGGRSLLGMPALCSTTACGEASANLSQLPASVLYLGGGVWAGLLAARQILSERLGIPDRLWLAALLGGVAFDGVLIGVLWANKTPCALCLGVAACIGLVLLLRFADRDIAALHMLAIWTAAFAGTIATIPPVYSETGLPKAAYSIESVAQAPKTLDLFLSLNCGHCQALLDEIQRTGFAGKIALHFPIQNLNREQAARIQFAIANSDGTLRSFIAAHSIDPKFLPAISSIEHEKLARQAKQAYRAYVQLGFRGVPAAVLQMPAMRVLLQGEENISSIAITKE